LISDPHAAYPAIFLESQLLAESATWSPQLDLLNNEGSDTVFVAEVEADGTAFLRFGDNRHGMRPSSGTAFTAHYRAGNGVAGNVGREAISHILSNESAITTVRNPLPAKGGIEPEGLEDVRQRAPSAFRTQERAVTERDYAEVTQRHSGVQRAAATFRWTGSWHTVFLTIDRLAGRLVDDPFERDVRAFVERFRMAGYDLEVDGPRFVSLELEMDVCVKPDYFRSEVRNALLQVFSNRVLPMGAWAFSTLTTSASARRYQVRSSQPRRLSPVDSSTSVFQRLDIDDSEPLVDGKLPLNRLEIARLDNDPNFPEHGVFRLNMVGGK
jgi:predicted phage baseplate assembly protein